MDGGPHDASLQRARTLLALFTGGLPDEGSRRDTSLALAGELLRMTRSDERLVDRARRRMLAGLAEDPSGQAFVTAVADRVYRAASSARAAEALRALVVSLGTPRFLPAPLRGSLALVEAGLVPDTVAVQGVAQGVRLAARGLVHDADPAETASLVRARLAERTRVNVNLVGEVVLGEEEALARAATYRALVEKSPAQAVSIKLSSIASQISLSAHEATLEMLAPRLLEIYRAARTRTPHVLVNLDMEAFDDLELTFALFTMLAEDRSIEDLTTGIVLQAYLPDAHGYYAALLEVARRRVARGGAPLRVRIVKGANLSMERHLAALRGHSLPTYGSKLETDASWLALVERAVRFDHARVLNVGVASHNVFDLAFALGARAEAGSTAFVELEMLEGMADPARRAFAELAGGMLVYAPITEPEAFDAAMAYLVRRLEEATTEGHFLRDYFAMEPGDERYERAKAAHLAARARRHSVSTKSRRAHARVPSRTRLEAPFENEPDTDFAVAAQRDPLLAAMTRARTGAYGDVGSIVRGEDRGGKVEHGVDPSRPGHVPYVARFGDFALCEDALDASVRSVWPEMTPHARAERLLDVAQGLREARAELVACMVADGGKRVVEADAEVSEAIDFAEYYARSAITLAHDERVRVRPRGTVLVASPWNFPLAIGVGGVLGALAAGNPVLLKPSSKTPLVAHAFVKLAHARAIPHDALSLLVIHDDVASEVVCDERVRAMVLTGSTRTARRIRALRPSLPLFAETGGKNAMIVTALADRDLAIRDAVHSAFGHAGQKCSATSLLVCEREVYDDPDFRARLADAAASLPVGSAWNPSSVVTPLIEPPTGPLDRALKTLEPGESWLLAPARHENPRLVSPSIKLGTREGSFTHETELFGPVLAMMRAEDLPHALRIANGTPYGLTGGIQSLDPREQSYFLEHARVGNAYVNRGTTGAIVRRQPFGGTKLSCFGPGAKAGGPSYVRQLSEITRSSAEQPTRPPSQRALAVLARMKKHLTEDEMTSLYTACAEAEGAYERALASPRDEAALPTQRNLFLRVPRERVLLILTGEDSAVRVTRTLALAATAGVRPEVSLLGFGSRAFHASLAEHVTLLPTEPAALGARLLRLGARTCVFVREPAEDVAQVLAVTDQRVLVAHEELAPEDAVGLWLEERSMTIEDHRYGQPLPERERASAPR